MQRPNDSSPLSRLPSEILLHCFSSSSSLWDMLHLAATCRWNRQIWIDNANTIYYNVSPRCIECRRYAHALLADQKGTPADPSPYLTVEDVLQLVRNTVVIERSVDHFNNTWVAHLAKTRNVGPAKFKYFYGKQRPPYLIKPERIRLIRALYQLWGLMLLDGETKHKKIESLRAKDLFAVMDIGYHSENMVLDKTVMDKAEDMKYTRTMWDDLVPYRMHLIEEKLSPPGGYRETSLDVGYMGRVSIWNDTCEEFKELTTYRIGGLQCPISDLWYDTDDEDFLVE